MPISTLAAHYIKTTTRLSNATPTDGEMYKISVKSANIYIMAQSHCRTVRKILQPTVYTEGCNDIPV